MLINLIVGSYFSTLFNDICISWFKRICFI